MKFVILCVITSAALSACTLVEGDRILGGDFAAAHPSFAEVDPRADFGPAPLAGARRDFKYFEVEWMARKYGVGLTAESPREACFERASVLLDANQLRAVLSGMLKDETLEVMDSSRSALPIGKPDFRREGLSPTGLWRGRWLYGENRSIPIWARVKTSSEVSPLRVPSPEREIERGDTVRVEIQSRGVRLSFDAAAESSGHLGELVTVRNPVNGQRFRAVVEGPGKVGMHK